MFGDCQPIRKTSAANLSLNMQDIEAEGELEYDIFMVRFGEQSTARRRLTVMVTELSGPSLKGICCYVCHRVR